MSKEVATKPEPANLIQVIERAAVNPAVDIDKMERLLQMQQCILAQNAKSAYISAFSEMQLDLPIIPERGRIDIGRGKPQGYALWEDINEGIKPVLQRHGFALTFRTGREGDQIIVTGVLSHRDGHSEETTIYLPADMSGSKNSVQAIGSSTSYGKRYTAQALLNLTSRGEDDDGAAGGAQTITDEQAGDIIALIEEVGANKGKFLKYIGARSVEEIPASKFAEAIAALEAKRSAA